MTLTGFQLETSGAVQMPEPFEKYGRGFWDWSDLSPFVQGYVEALLRHLNRDLLVDGEVPFGRIAPETLARIMEDCETIQRMFSNFSEVFPINPGREFYIRRQRGNYRSHGFPPLTVSLNDDGKVVFQ